MDTPTPQELQEAKDFIETFAPGKENDPKT